MEIHRSLECDVCMKAFDSYSRRPKILPCGHTFCLLCLETTCRGGIVICAQDRKEFSTVPQDLPDNFYILSIGRSSSIKRFWCMDCNDDADTDCTEEHFICSLKKGRLQAVREQVVALEKQCEILPQLLQKLAVVGGPGAVLEQSSLVEHNTRTQAAIQAFQNALDVPGDEWKDALQSWELESKQMSSQLVAVKDAFQLVSSEELDIMVGSSRIGRWRGRLEEGADKVPSQEWNALRYAICRLRMADLLNKVDHGTDDTDKRVGSRQITCTSLCDKPNPPISDEDILDFTHFHHTYGYSNNEMRLQQLLSSREKARKLVGLGSYHNGSLSTQATTEWPLENVWHIIQRAMMRHYYTVEEVSMLTGCIDQLLSALKMPKIRKLDIFRETQWKCRCSRCPESCKIFQNLYVTRDCKLQCVTIRCSAAGEHWGREVLFYGNKSLREVVICNVPLTKFPAVWPDAWAWLPQKLREVETLQSVTLVRPGEACPGGPVCAAQLSDAGWTGKKRIPARCATCTIP